MSILLIAFYNCWGGAEGGSVDLILITVFIPEGYVERYLYVTRCQL